jgi:hypothetical protein
MTSHTDEIITALRAARQRLARVMAELERHLASEPADDHYALAAYERVTRKLRDDIAVCESDVSMLSRMLASAAQADAQAL